MKTSDSSVSPGPSRCKPYTASRSKNTSFSSQRTNLHVPSLLAPSGSSKYFLWPFHFFLDSISLSPGLLLSPLKATLPCHPSGDLKLGEEPPISAASTAQTYSLLPSLSSIPTVTEATLPKVTSDSPSANAVTFSQSSSSSTFLSVSHCRPSLLHFFGKSIFASITL